MAKLNKTDRLFEIFCGEAISVSLDRDLEQTQSTRTKIETIKTSQTLHGYLVDHDDFYLYLGGTPDTICTAIKKSNIVSIELYEETDISELMEIGDLPKGEGDYN